MKKYYGKITVETAKHCLYIDEQGVKKTSILWKKYAKEHGWIAENLLFKKNGKFIIYSTTSNKTIKVLKRV